MCVCHSLSRVRLFSTPEEPARLLYPWNSPGKNTGVDCHSLLQGDLPNPGIEPGSSALQADSLLSEPPGVPHQAMPLCEKKFFCEILPHFFFKN